MSDTQIYRVLYHNHEEIHQVYVKHLYQGDLYGFVVLEDFIFDEESSIVIDPSEERLKNEFDGVSRSFIPMHEVIRIDQVDRRGAAKITPLGNKSSGDSSTTGNVTPLYTPAPEKR